jgi:predicted dehydrogenase
MIAAPASSGKRLMFNFNNRARPESYAMKSYIADGTVGAINSAQAKWIRRTGIPGFGGWFTTKALSGGGPLIDLLHMIDLALYFMGYPEPAHVLGADLHDFITTRASRGPGASPTRRTASPMSRRRPRLRHLQDRPGAEPPGLLGGNGEARGGLRRLPGHQEPAARSSASSDATAR